MSRDRVRDLQRRVQASDVDLVVLNPSPSFTLVAGHEFTSHERLFLLFVPADGSPAAVVPLLEKGNWAQAVPNVDAVYPWDDKDGSDDAARAACARFRSARRVGIEPLAMRYMEYSVLRRFLPEAEFVSADPIVGPLRLIKSAEDAKKMRRAAEIAEQALRTTLSELRVGMTEREIAGRLSSLLLAGGGEGISFGPIVLSGAKSALPHGEPDDRRIGQGEYLLIDYGTSYQGYHCDITRTFSVGQPSDRMRQVYEAVRAGNAAGCAASRPGATYEDVHLAAQAPLRAEQFDDFMKHRTGHGLGLDVHEPPSVMEGNLDPIEQGVIFTVEPGLYLEDWGGVRIEDDLWITGDGAESLTSYPRELQILGE